MLFSERDMAALRLLCWCQYVRPEELGCLATETEVKNLMCLGLVKRHRSSGAYALTIQGRSFMAELFPGGIPDLAETYHKDAIQRRLRVARPLLKSSPYLPRSFSRQSPEAVGATPGGAPVLPHSPAWAIWSAVFTMSVPGSAKWRSRMNSPPLPTKPPRFAPCAGA